MKKSLFYKVLFLFGLLTQITTIFGMKNQKNPQCNICQKILTNNRQNNIDHLLKKHLQCPWCNAQPFSLKINFLKHVKAHHSNERIYSCMYCKFISVRSYEARRHMGLTNNRRIEKCFSEVKHFINNIWRKTHYNHCDYCNQSFEKINNHFLYKHDMWLYGLSDIITKIPAHNTLGIDLRPLTAHLPAPTENNNNGFNNNNNNNNISENNIWNNYEVKEMLSNLEVEEMLSNLNDIEFSNNLDNVKCPNCTLIFQDLHSYCNHIDECLDS